jgi:hypothetical protein
MPLTRKILQILGTLAILVGLIWAGQGSGWFPYPKSSFMIDQAPWIWRGLVLAAVGVVAIAASRRMR